METYKGLPWYLDVLLLVVVVGGAGYGCWRLLKWFDPVMAETVAERVRGFIRAIRGG